MPIRILDDRAVKIYKQQSAGDMSKISSLGGMMQMMGLTKDGVNRKSRIVRSLIHCVGKVTTGFLTSKKAGLFFWESVDDQEFSVVFFSSLTLKISHLSKFDSFLGK